MYDALVSVNCSKLYITDYGQMYRDFLEHLRLTAKDSLAAIDAEQFRVCNSLRMFLTICTKTS